MRSLGTYLATCVVALAMTTQCSAGIIALVSGNDVPDGINWLNNVQGVTGLDQLVKEDTPGGVSGPEAGNWSLTLGSGSRSGSWTITNTGVVPEYWFVKFDGLVAVYQYDGPNSSPYSDSYDLETEVYDSSTQELFIDIVDSSGNLLYAAGSYSGGTGNPWARTGFNPKAATSHVSVYGQGDDDAPPEVPEPTTLALWVGMIGAAGFVRRYR